MADLHTEVSMTEVAHFARLVALLNEVERLAQERNDTELKALVDACREDLRALTAERHG